MTARASRIRQPARRRLGRGPIMLAADLGDGTDDRRATAPGLLRRALAACRSGPGLRPGRDARGTGCSPGGWPAPPTTRPSPSRSARGRDARPAVAAAAPASPKTPRTMPSTWTAPRSPYAEYCPVWWPADTRLLIRWVLPRNSPGFRRSAVPAPPPPAPGPAPPPDPRAGPRRGDLRLSFVLTNLGVCGPDEAVGGEALVPAPHHGARTCPRQQSSVPPSGACPRNTPRWTLAWMSGSLLAASMSRLAPPSSPRRCSGEGDVDGRGVRSRRRP